MCNQNLILFVLIIGIGIGKSIGNFPRKGLFYETYYSSGKNY